MYKKLVYIFLLFATFSINKILAQKPKKKLPPESIQIPANILIKSSTDSLLANYDNDIYIQLPFPVNIYEIAISQGIIRNNYEKAISIDGLNTLYNLKPGTVTISIYCNKNGKKQIAKQKTFGVKEKILPQYPRHITPYLNIQPKITINGYDTAISVSAVRTATKIDVNLPYKILKYSLITGTDILMYESSTSMFFNERMKSVFNRYIAGSTFIIDEILIEDNEGFTYRYPPMIFKVIADK